MKRIFRLFAIAIVALASLASCGGSDEPTILDPTPTPDPTPVPELTVPDYVTIDAMDDGTEVTLIKDKRSSPQTIPNPNLLYSLDGETWQNVTIDAPITLNKDQKVMIKAAEGGNKRFCEGSAVSFQFNTQDASHRINVSGNIMYLLDGDNPATILTTENGEAFRELFRDCKGLVSAKNLKLPATTLTDLCYMEMFHECKLLTEAPELPATNLAWRCYSMMFEECLSLTKAPALPATTLNDFCYSNMFTQCTSLTEAPELPATNLTEGCYSGMFSECSSLTKAPALPATNLAHACYSGMFSGCIKLTKAPELPAINLKPVCYSRMFESCTSLTTSPLLRASKLVSLCYNRMFANCSNLNKVMVLFTDWNVEDDGESEDGVEPGTTSWLDGVSPSGTFHCYGLSTSIRNSSKIPEDWAIGDVELRWLYPGLDKLY